MTDPINTKEEEGHESQSAIYDSERVVQPDRLRWDGGSGVSGQ